MEGEATPTRSVPLPVEEKEEETEEAREEEEGTLWWWPRGCVWWSCSPHHLKFLFKILKWDQLSLTHFIDVIAADKFSYICK